MSKFIIDVEIPRFTVSIPINVETWEEAARYLDSHLVVTEYLKFVRGATWMDSDKPKLVAIINQE